MTSAASGSTSPASMVIPSCGKRTLVLISFGHAENIAVLK